VSTANEHLSIHRHILLDAILTIHLDLLSRPVHLSRHFTFSCLFCHTDRRGGLQTLRSGPRPPVRQGVRLIVYHLIALRELGCTGVRSEVDLVTGRPSASGPEGFRKTDTCSLASIPRVGLRSAILSIRTGLDFTCSRTISKMKLLGASVFIVPGPA